MDKNRKMKIISLMSYPPAYELYWKEQQNAAKVGTRDRSRFVIAEYEWIDLMGREILKLTDKFEYEAWQPDLLADGIYSRTLEGGLKHKLFPALYKRRLFGFKLVNDIYSKMMIVELRKEIKEGKIIIHLNSDPLLFKYILSSFDNIPIILTYHGVIQLPSTNLFSYTKNIPSKLNHLKDYFWLKKNINKIDYVTYQNNTNLNGFRKIYRGILRKLTMGCDFSFWHPQNPKLARNELGLPHDRKIFFTASRFVSAKQIDKLIFVLTELSDRYDFLLIIAGHGTKTYEDYLKCIASNLSKKNKIKFVGYIQGEKFRSYFNASDFFILASTDEGASVSVMNAFACEVPVISTKTGNTAELMEKYDCGYLLDIHDYKKWRDVLEGILKGKLEIKPMDREIVKKHYDWSNIAQKLLNIYNEMAYRYYS